MPTVKELREEAKRRGIPLKSRMLKADIEKALKKTSPKKRASSPKKRASSPKKRASSPKKRASSPKKRASSPKKRASSPKKVYGTYKKIYEKMLLSLNPGITINDQASNYITDILLKLEKALNKTASNAKDIVGEQYARIALSGRRWGVKSYPLFPIPENKKERLIHFTAVEFLELSSNEAVYFESNVVTLKNVKSVIKGDEVFNEMVKIIK